jgi:hypothetical protein
MRFSQCEPPLATFIARDPASSYGICATLSTCWILEHAAGRSLFTWLYTGFEKSGNAARGVGMRMGRLTNVMSLRGEGDAALDAGLRVMGDKVPLGAADEARVFTSQALASAICDTAAHDAGRYLMIGIEGTVGAHSMAAYVATDVCFFDPNFGEFWFENHHMFQAWFTGYFWHASMYGVGLGGSYRVRSYSGRA